MVPAAVLDACVLYPVSLRDTLLNVAEAGLFLVLWTEEILTETARNIVRDTGLNDGAPREDLRRHATRLSRRHDQRLRNTH